MSWACRVVFFAGRPSAPPSSNTNASSTERCDPAFLRKLLVAFPRALASRGPGRTAGLRTDDTTDGRHTVGVSLLQPRRVSISSRTWWARGHSSALPRNPRHDLGLGRLATASGEKTGQDRGLGLPRPAVQRAPWIPQRSGQLTSAPPPADTPSVRYVFALKACAKSLRKKPAQEAVTMGYSSGASTMTQVTCTTGADFLRRLPARMSRGFHSETLQVAS